MRILGPVTMRVVRTRMAGVNRSTVTLPVRRVWARAVRSAPTRIRALVAAAVVLTFALCAVLAVAVREARAGLDLVGHHSGPVVVSTSNLYFALADMDAQVANVLLVGSRTDLGVTRAGALDVYDKRRTEVDGYLQQTAAYAGRDPAAGRDLRAVLNALGRYHGLAAQSILAESQTAAEAGRPPPQALDLYRQATDVMHDDLLPAALRLTDDEVAQVEHEYADARSAAGTATGWVVVLGLALLAVLVALQVLLARDHHRMVNPAIAVATLAVLGLLVTGLSTVTGAEEQLRVAKEEAFDYAVALHQARAVGYDANADESRYLVDPARAARYEAAFHAKSQQIVRTDAAGVAQYDRALAAGLEAYDTDHRTVTFDGFLGRALRHAAFAGERAADERALARYRAYQAADRRIRALNTSGDLEGAIRFCTSVAPGGSNALFAEYDAALGELIAINERAFADAVAAGENTLSGWAWPPPVVAVVVAVLIFAGAAPRLAEYRA
jgi:hypothetical protein